MVKIEKKLNKFGFAYSGMTVVRVKGRIDWKLDKVNVSKQKNVMYALTYKNKVFYLCETKRELSKRLQGYKTPSKNKGQQSTNNKVHTHMLKYNPVKVFYKQIKEKEELINSNATERLLSEIMNR